MRTLRAHRSSISRWPPPDFDVSRAREEHALPAQIVLSAHDWGAPTWTSLTAAQRLSLTLVRMMLLDSIEKMANPDVVEMQPAFDICRWQLLNAAASSHLCCPPEPSTLKKSRNRRVLSIADWRYQAARTRMALVTGLLRKSYESRKQGKEVAWRHEHNIKDDISLDADFERGKDGGLTMTYLGRELLFQDVECNTIGVVPEGNYEVEWSYVIDLDNHAFTINGLMSLTAHFWRVPFPRDFDDDCIPTFAHPPSVPIEHIAAVSRWPHPGSSQRRGAPAWNCLTVTQQLSADLVQTVLFDSAEKLSNPDAVEINCYWFRGCLVAFRHRLDVVEHVEYETVQMINHLRKYGRTTGIGVVFSGRHILAVAVDGDIVRCSHPLLFHDPKMNCQDGFLLAVHLLSPILTVDKTSWMHTLAPKSVSSAPIGLPQELIRQIMFLLDHDSYQNLERVSRIFREMHAAYPRVGNHVLLRHIDSYNYLVHDAVTGTESMAYFQRSAPFQSCRRTLVPSFQRVSFGPHNLYPGFHYLGGVIRGTESEHSVVLNREVEWDGDSWSMIRLQAVHGV
ncbi:hypothetical protein FRC06_011396 [Ceratobasidium sp. 370]|nr:hypothetical protein FRC06_011396 [Ceratobasidium sp. 370]